MSGAKTPLLNPYFDLHVALLGTPTETRLALRKKLIWAYSWAIPSAEAIETIAALGPIVELGAGTGYWAWLVRQAGARVYAYDHEPSQPPHWSDVARGDVKVLKQHADCALFLCWPPFESTMAFEAIESFAGERVIYVGEFEGRTADSRFHDELKRTFSREREIAIPNWPGFHDKLYLFKRR